MNVIVINSTSPTFECTSPACYIDSESINTAVVYDNEYVSSCNIPSSIPYSGGAGSIGPAGPAGADGVGISSITGPTTVGLVDTYTIHYTNGTTDTFDVTNGAAGVDGADGADGAQGIQGIQGIQGVAGTNGTMIYTGTGAPAVGLGANGDLYLDTASYNLYKKAAGSWPILVNIKGADGEDGAPGINGTNGDAWIYGAGAPVDLTVKLFDTYYVDTNTNDVWYKEVGTQTWGAAPITNLNGDSYYTTSTTSITLSSLTIGDTVAITTASSTMSYSIGQFLVVANATTDYFTCKILSYAGTALSVEVIYIKQTTAGALASWSINLAGITESESLPDWYEITATAGTGTLVSRTFTGPSGWDIGAATTISVAGLSDITPSASDLIIKHNTGFKAIECVVYTNDSTKYTKTQTPVGYSTMYVDLTDIAIKLTQLCAESQALKIYVKLIP